MTPTTTEPSSNSAQQTDEIPATRKIGSVPGHLVDVPEDIFETACGIVMNAKSLKSMLRHTDVIDAIALALKVERERHYDARWANKAVQDVKDSFSGALWEISDERWRQIDDEGWTVEHDDMHTDNELSRAAACYCIGNIGYWPWDLDWWKPSDRRRDLVKAGALIVAEIERLDRLKKQSSPSHSIPLSHETGEKT